MDQDLEDFYTSLLEERMRKRLARDSWSCLCELCRVDLFFCFLSLTIWREGSSAPCALASVSLVVRGKLVVCAMWRRVGRRIGTATGLYFGLAELYLLILLSFVFRLSRAFGSWLGYDAQRARKRRGDSA